MQSNPSEQDQHRETDDKEEDSLGHRTRMHAVLVRNESLVASVAHATYFFSQEMTINLLNFATVRALGVRHFRALLSVRFADGRSIANLE